MAELKGEVRELQQALEGGGGGGGQPGSATGRRSNDGFGSAGRRSSHTQPHHGSSGLPAAASGGGGGAEPFAGLSAEEATLKLVEVASRQAARDATMQAATQRIATLEVDLSEALKELALRTEEDRALKEEVAELQRRVVRLSSRLMSSFIPLLSAVSADSLLLRDRLVLWIARGACVSLTIRAPRPQFFIRTATTATSRTSRT